MTDDPVERTPDADVVETERERPVSSEPKASASESAAKREASATESNVQAADGDYVSAPEHFINRELSFLEFNQRVLDLAQDESIPILDRLRFLTISSTNLDEFFEIRVAGHKQWAAVDPGKVSFDGLTPAEILHEISGRAHGFVTEQYRVLNEVMLPALGEAGIRRIHRREMTRTQRKWCTDYFEEKVLPVLTPVGLDPAHPFPKIINKSLNFVVGIEGKDAFGRGSGIAVVHVPRCLPRVIVLPRDQVAEGTDAYILLSAIIRANIGALFPGMTPTGCYQFRVTRDSDLWVDEEDVTDLLDALKGELPGRRYGNAVRLEVDRRCTAEMARFLLRKFDLGDEDLYQVGGPVNLHRLEAVCQLFHRPDLKYRRSFPGMPKTFLREADIFEVLDRRDVLLHHPFQSFAPVVEMIRQAAVDPDVLAIKQTLYRTDPGSVMVEALVDAARSGKEVTAVVELRARFDEAANIKLANALQEAGAQVVYGVVGYKTHAKMLMVLRREGEAIRRYAHLGTGNYHPKTVEAYTDLGLMTSDPDLCEDVHKVFLQLTGLGEARELKRLLQSPFTLVDSLLASIEAEAEAARRGEKARIIAKMNSLSNRDVIEALYRASQAGVEIDLIVRGICCLRPGLPGVSDNIRVRSILGRYLEHTRVFYFWAGGEERTYGASADWMSRNLFRRVETAFPIEDVKIRKRVIDEVLENYLADNCQAWLLEADGSYTPPAALADDVERHSAQETLAAKWASMKGPVVEGRASSRG